MNKLIRILLTTSAVIFILLGFALPLNPPAGNWYQQFFPNLNGRTISDITFTDSLTGYACTRYGSNDTNYILRSTNGGDNWNIVYRQFTYSNRPFRKVQFLNRDTGYCGGNKFLKTINTGLNWDTLPLPYGTSAIDFHALNEDTLWFTDDLPFDGGIYRSTDKGISWFRQYDATPAPNPERIYMYNGRIGFMSRQQYFYKTTTSGNNWFTIPGGTNYGAFRDIYFINDLTGWKANPLINDTNFRKTTDGGLNWFVQRLPHGGNITSSSGIADFVNINRDTIFGVGGAINYGINGIRAIIYRSTDGGNNWLFQIPDTSYAIPAFTNIDFVSKYTGWAYTSYFKQQLNQIVTEGIHTTTGGDTNWISGIKQISTRIAKNFKLYQNFPNPFNSNTTIIFDITNLKNSHEPYIKLVIYDVIGKVVTVLVNQKLKSGSYKVEFNGIDYSSGIYFYSLIVNNKYIETKKLILIK